MPIRYSVLQLGNGDNTIMKLGILKKFAPEWSFKAKTNPKAEVVFNRIADRLQSTKNKNICMGRAAGQNNIQDYQQYKKLTQSSEPKQVRFSDEQPSKMAKSITHLSSVDYSNSCIRRAAGIEILRNYSPQFNALAQK
ncbi:MULTISPECIES: hypothetical protein [Yersinia]|nr:MULTISPECIES: hypothetical protein [Yersinia]MCB5309850.1 hypothetical protein [Yersinia massiliensis]